MATDIQLEPVQYVARTRHGGYRIAGTRVSLDSIIHAYWAGQSAEAIVPDFPTLTVEQVYAAIAFYLRNREALDEYMKGQEQEWEAFRRECDERNRDLRERIRRRAASSQQQDPSL